MNVDGAFILAETRRKTSVLQFVDNSMQIYLIMNLGRCLSHVFVKHAFKTNIKMSKLWSKCFSALDFEPWCCELVKSSQAFLRALISSAAPYVFFFPLKQETVRYSRYIV